MQTQAARFSCDTCGQLFAWKPELAGKKMKCLCGNLLIVPRQAEMDQEGLYEFADDPAPRLPPRHVTAHPAPSAPAAEVTPQRVAPIEYARLGSTTESWMDRYFPDRVKDFYLPLGLVVFGTVVRVIFAVVFSTRGRHSIPYAMRDLAVDLVGSTFFMLLAVLFTARVRQIQIGPLPVAILKLCGVTIGALGITLTIGPLLAFLPIIGGLLVWALSFAAIFTLLGALFDMDESDTWFCVCVLFVMNVVVYLTLQGLKANGWF